MANVQADSLYTELDRQLTNMEEFFKERREADIRKEVDMFQMVGYFLLDTLSYNDDHLLVSAVFFLD